MPRTSQGVDVILDDSNSGQAPHCAHGPCLLFERFTDGSVKRFYACSACRDRKECGAFQHADQWLSNKTRAARNSVVKQQQRAPLDAKQCKVRLAAVRRLPEEKRLFCRDCALLVLPTERETHSSHTIVSGLKKAELRKPSRLLTPRDNNKTNAQYFFSDETVGFLVDTMLAQGATKVLCLGVPRVHEEIDNRQRSGANITSLLLDIDHRLMQFYPGSQFCRYNMFNHYFFPPSRTREAYNDFLSLGQGDKLLVVMDPPFGGLVEVLAHTVNRIRQDFKLINPGLTEELGFLWVFPYFLEARITQELPEFSMLDYKVVYDNHREYSKGQNAHTSLGGKVSQKQDSGSKQGQNKHTSLGVKVSGKQDSGSKHGSPVRIFTNLSPAQVKLPSNGYRFCKMCKKYTWKSNKHCDQCRACTSKDGQQYSHCSVCQRCVKPSWSHCTTCNGCHLPQYNCTQKPSGCHICGSPEHKRRECPQRQKGKINIQQKNPERKNPEREDPEPETPPVQHSKHGQKRKKEVKESMRKKRKTKSGGVS